MNLLKNYREGKALYRRQKALAATGQAPHVRMDICPAGVAMASMRGIKAEQTHIKKTPDYSQAIEAAAELLQSQPSLYQDRAIFFNFWPDQVSHRGMLIGAGQFCQNAAELDMCIQQTPEIFSLDTSYSYRVLDTGLGTRVDCVGVSVAGWERLDQALPVGAVVSRHWGALTALEVLYPKLLGSVASSAVLLGIMDLNYLSLFSFEGKTLRGVRVVERSQFLNSPPPLLQLLHSFSLTQEAEILFVNLTQKIEDWEAFHHGFSGHFQVLGTPELVKYFPQLEIAQDFPMLPIGLLATGAQV